MSAAPGHHQTLFRTNEDYLIWENYTKRCDTLEGLTLLRSKQRDGRTQLLRRAYEQRETKNPHPHCADNRNARARSRLWLIRLRPGFAIIANGAEL
jgi:hypothetical protein